MYESVDAATQEYAAKYTTALPALLQQLEQETNRHVSQPHMLSGPVQGMLLQMISHMVQPAQVLEIGTFTGYSAICLARGLREGGRLHTIDRNTALIDMCRSYFRQAGLEDRIVLHTGQAEEIIPALEGPFDLVFIDADKINYGKYFDMVIDKVRTGGFLLADNVLFHGEVLKESSTQSNSAKAIAAFNEKISADARVEQVLLTIRDGLLLMRKIK